jgi:dolichyl-phosphate-mannose-protein mannosyltransferase
MASNKAAVTTGADHDVQATRRRNVPSTPANGGLVNRVEVDEKKRQVKKVSDHGYPWPWLPAGHSIQRIQLTCPQSQQTILEFLDEWEFLIAPLIFTILAFFTRLYKIGLSPIVTWDEAQ